jgi:hypothetical protein
MLQQQLFAERPMCYPPNSDIAGLGVRVSVYVLLCSVMLFLVLGIFHCGQSGTKELGIAVMSSMFYAMSSTISAVLTLWPIDLFIMTLNLAKIRPGTLTPTDLFITVAMLDTQSIALSAVLSSKDALASRWYVMLTAIVQCFVWSVVLVSCTHLRNLSFYNSENLCCLRETWMSSYFHTCGSKVQLRFSLLAYWITHAYDTIQSTILAVLHTTLFDSLDKVDRQSKSDGNLYVSQSTPTLYGRIPSTAFSNWSGFVF